MAFGELIGQEGERRIMAARDEKGGSMWHEDLSPYREFGPESQVCLRAVGWLDRANTFPTGPVDAAVYLRLIALSRDPWEPCVSLGVHQCELCQYEGAKGSKRLYVPGDGVVYVAPELITHFMNAHGYRPPEEFCVSVLKCPEMRSIAYLKSMLSIARPFMRAGG